ncbi:hypothetical protein GAYE_SCF39G5303 [Galdieria yellowstonensis]|uniref:Uncharacterized protein n=1 Tax=Galdieria yellowstonensis TaxID=3028027 RepID=A0AAV9IJ90_9RHOD|nr:hypothetical protein GAYE_SCF39G5303 [Galdieria yellowstonensis]
MSNILTTEEVNYLIFRYLQESGYIHTAFAFGYESHINKTTIDSSLIPPGALISFLQRGISYVQIESKLNISSSNEYVTNGHVSLLEAHKALANRKRVPNVANGEEASKGTETEFTEAEVTLLTGHQREVFACAWHPKRPLLASASADATARLWKLSSHGEGSMEGTVESIELKHGSPPLQDKDVTALEWNGDGSLLATGCYDGQIRLWNDEGQLHSAVETHTGPIFAIEWNRRGNFLLSGSVDKTCAVYDVTQNRLLKRFAFHSGPVLDVDWRDDTSFASCSTDKTIYVCRVDEEAPLRVFHGHDDEINTVRWDPSGSMLASCSDDRTVKVWTLESRQVNSQFTSCLYDFREHSRDVYAVSWSPSGPGTENPNKALLLASASFDHTVKLWDIQSGICQWTLSKHTEPVYSVSFSPDGEYIASGSLDKYVHVWSIREGRVVRSFRADGGIFDVCWSPSGDQIAASLSSNTVCVLDFRM